MSSLTREILSQDVKVSHEKRLRNLLVDYKEGQIKFGVAVESQKLKRIIEVLKEEVERLKLSWQLADSRKLERKS